MVKQYKECLPVCMHMDMYVLYVCTVYAKNKPDAFLKKVLMYYIDVEYVYMRIC